ncbi:MAG: PAS domain-containing protein [Proteobacteria bacterium]|nr:PAS domain-containing protein [Pseudomonadota bacterium]
MEVLRQDYIGVLAEFGLIKPEVWQPFFDLLKAAGLADEAFVALFTATGYLHIGSEAAVPVRFDNCKCFDNVSNSNGVVELDVTLLAESLSVSEEGGVLLATSIRDYFGGVHGVLGMFQAETEFREQGIEVLELVSGVASAVCWAFLPQELPESINDTQRHALLSISEDLCAAQSELQTLLDNVPAAIIVTDEDGGIIRGNRLALEMFSASDTPLTFFNISDFVIDSAVSLSENTPLRTLVKDAMGNLFPVVMAATTRDVLGQTKEILYTLTDLSSIVEIELMASHARAELDRFIELVRVPILMLDQQGFIVGCNSNAAAILGVPPEEALGQEFIERFMDEVDSHQNQAAFDQLANGEDLQNLQLKIRSADGGLRYVLVSITARFDSKGNHLGHIAFGQDITEIRMNEKILNQNHKLETLGQLTTGITHDFNNLLNIISGNLRLLVSVFPEKSDEREIVDDTISAAEDAGELVSSLLAFARDDYGAIARMNVSEGITKVTRVSQRVINRRITLDIATVTSDLEVDVDPIWFESSLLNLITNAADAIGEQGGSISIGTECVELERVPGFNLPPGRYVRVWVQDTGPGIPVSMRNRMFEPFFTTKSNDKGMGLGLSMVYRFCQRSGGYCELDETYEKGARFMMILPLAEEQLIGKESISVSEVQGIDEVPSVLVVEDDERVRRVIIRDFRRMGFACQQAGSADEALLILREDHAFSLVFSDVIMPGVKDGFELADWIQKNQPDLPVVLTSGYVGKEGIKNDSVELITKPYDVGELERLVVNLIK